MKKHAILFKTHFLNDKIIREYNNLTSHCDSKYYDVFLLYDNSKNDFKPARGMKYFLFNEEDLRKLGPDKENDLPQKDGSGVVLESKFQWIHADYPPVVFYNKNTEYQYYWQIEFDVRFNGNWNKFFDFYKDSDADFVSAQIKTKAEYPTWGGWGSHNLKVEDDVLLESPFPLVRYSNRALQLLGKEFKSGKEGYCEVITPTILNIHNYKILGIDEKFYSDKTFQVLYLMSEYVYSFLKILPWNKNKLFHPIKDEKLSRLFEVFSNIIIGKIGTKTKDNIPRLFKILKPYFPNKR